MKKNLSFLATAVGSLPHTNQTEAIDLIFDTIPNAPICPQLSQAYPNEDMLRQYTENFPGIEINENTNNYFANLNSDKYFSQLENLFIDYEEIISTKKLSDEILDKYAISEKYASCFPYFLEKINSTQPPYIKGQIIGPFTFGTSILDEEKKCSFYDETFRDVIAKTLTLKALWQAKEFKKASGNSKIIMFLDEPTLSQLGTSAFLTVSPLEIQEIINQIVDALHDFDIIVGTHCCGKADWQLLLNSNLDLINFDAFFFTQNFTIYAKDIEKFINRNGIIAWGIVPTLDIDALNNTTIDELINIFETGKNILVQKGIDENKIINSSIITPSCGAGSLCIKDATKAMNYLKQLSVNLKNKYNEAIL